jgi:hypothetical protein
VSGASNGICAAKICKASSAICQVNQISLPKTKFCYQEPNFITKSNIFCQEQNLFAKNKIYLPRIKFICQAQILVV